MSYPSDLTPTEELVLEVLIARYRLGETYWSFNARHRAVLERLEDRDLIGYKSGIAPNSYQAWLGDAGLACLDDTYEAPSQEYVPTDYSCHQDANGRLCRVHDRNTVHMTHCIPLYARASDLAEPA